MSDAEKIELEPGDEIRLTYRGNGKFSVQRKSEDHGVQLLLGAVARPLDEIADYLRKLL